MPKVMEEEIVVNDVPRAEEATVDRVEDDPIPKEGEVVLGDEMTLEAGVEVAVQVLEVIQDLEEAEDHAGSQVEVAVRAENLRVEAIRVRAHPVVVKHAVPS
jgi:hypothetical protein